MTHEIPEWLRWDMERKRKARATRKAKQAAELFRIALVVVLTAAVLLAVLLQPYTIHYERQDEVPQAPHIEIQSAYASVATYHVTGYNTVPEQTDSTPCIAASGADICGRTDVVACPRAIALGTELEIDGKVYTCLDRLAPKYDHRIDVSCDKDKTCPALVTGYKEVKILK